MSHTADASSVAVGMVAVASALACCRAENSTGCRDGMASASHRGYLQTRSRPHSGEEEEGDFEVGAAGLPAGLYIPTAIALGYTSSLNLILILFNFYVIIILVEDHARTRLSQCAAPPPVSAIDMAHHHALVCMRIGAEVRNKAQRSSSGCGWALVQMAVGPMHASKTCNAKRSRTRWRSRRAPPPLSPLSQFHKGLPLCSG